MLTELVRFSPRCRLVVLVAAVLVLVFGVIVALRTPLDVFPEFAPPLVEVQVEAPGLSSEAVESLVTIPLESAVNGVPRMTVLRSKSVQGLSSITMLFESGPDIYKARQMVAERVGVARAGLPQQLGTPKMMPVLSSTSRILKLGLTPKHRPGLPDLSQTEISVLMKWVIEPRLRAVPGVA